jgi:hypothetical protein
MTWKEKGDDYEKAFAQAMKEVASTTRAQARERSLLRKLQNK